MEVMATLLRAGSFRVGINPTPPPAPVFSPDANKCIHTEWTLSAGNVMCGNKAQRKRHGWLCAAHEPLEQRVSKPQQYVEIDGQSIAVEERKRLSTGAHGVRFNHWHLMKATVYNADGSAKYKW